MDKCGELTGTAEVIQQVEEQLAILKQALKKRFGAEALRWGSSRGENSGT